MKKKLNVVIWNEFRHEKKYDHVKAIYPNGMHATIKEFLEIRANYMCERYVEAMQDLGYENPFIDFEVISTYIYKHGVVNGNYADATAFGLAQSFISLILLLSAILPIVTSVNASTNLESVITAPTIHGATPITSV